MDFKERKPHGLAHTLQLLELADCGCVEARGVTVVEDVREVLRVARLVLFAIQSAPCVGGCERVTAGMGVVCASDCDRGNFYRILPIVALPGPSPPNKYTDSDTERTKEKREPNEGTSHTPH